MISIVAAMDEKRGIGKGNDLLFKIPEDFERMKSLTMGKAIIMGRRTFESIGRILPGRYNIVITRDEGYKIGGLKNGENGTIVSSLEEAIKEANKQGKDVVVFGGGQVFKEALEKGLVDALHLTLVEGDYGADTFFPEYSGFKTVREESRESDGFKYKFVDLEKA